MLREGLTSRLELYLCLLKEQEAQGVDRTILEGLAKHIIQLNNQLGELTEQEIAMGVEEEEITLDSGVTYTRKVIEPHEFAYGKPKKWKPRTSVRKGNSLVVKRAHPSWIPWHGRLA